MSKHETRDALRNFNVSLVLRGVYDSICGGNTLVFASFALALGIPKEKMGYVATVIGGAIILQVLVLPVIGRLRDKKRFVLRLGILEPLVLVAVVLAAPLLPMEWRFPCFAGALFLAASAANLVRPLGDEWLASTIPSRVRGVYTGLRLRIGAITFAAVTLLTGWLVGVVGQDNTSGLAWLLAGGAVAGVLAILRLRANRMPAVSSAAAVTLADVRAMMQNRPFRRLVAVFLFFNLPFLFTVPYYQVYNLEVVKLSPARIAMVLTGYQIMKILLLGWAGRLVDRFGARICVFLVAPVYVGFFGFMSMGTPGMTWPIVLAWLLAGIGDSVYGVAVVSALYAALPDNPSRSAYFAVYNLLTMGLFAIGGFLAVPMLAALDGLEWSIFGQTYGNFNIFVFGAAVLMIPAVFAALLLPGRKPVSAKVG